MWQQNSSPWGFEGFQLPAGDTHNDQQPADRDGGNFARREDTAVGFLKVVGEDEDNLVMQREIQEEEQRSASDVIGGYCF